MTRQPKTPSGFLSLATRSRGKHDAKRAGGAPWRTAGGFARDVLSVLEHGDCDASFAVALAWPRARLACKDLGFTLALADQDLGLAVGLAGQADMPVEVSAVMEQVYRRARAQYGDAGGEMLPVKLYEDLTRAPSAASWTETPAIGGGRAFASYREAEKALGRVPGADSEIVTFTSPAGPPLRRTHNSERQR